MGLTLLKWPNSHSAFLGRRPTEARIAPGPWNGATRVVVIRPWFAVAGRAVVCRHLDYSALSRRKPQVIAAPVPVLRQITAGVLSGDVRLDPPERGFVALAGVGRQPPTQQDVDMVWLAFGTPLRAEFRSWTGALLARDCELRSGLHVLPDCATFVESETGHELLVALANANGDQNGPKMVPTGLQGRIDTTPCPCGDPSPRLADLRAIEQEQTPKTFSATA